MTDPLREFQAAARRYARHVLPGSVPRRVIVIDERGERIADVRIPNDGGDVWPTPESLATPKAGWDFSGAVPRFDGAIVSIHGKKLDLLRLLVEANSPLSIDKLRAAWDGYPAEESTIRWTLGELRKSLTQLFPGLEEPVPSGPGGYTIAIR